MKILFLDIETAPNTVYTWDLWNTNISTDKIIESSRVLCWAAKWYGSDKMLFSSERGGVKRMLNGIHKLLDEADVVIHYNGTKFDIPKLNKEFVSHGFPPPSPFKQIDLYRTARSRFKFVSNKLDWIANALGLGQKIRHKGFELWIECMKHDPEAWKQMEEYNKQDVILLEKLYEVFRPWIKNHPHSLEEVCPTCQSRNYQSRGMYTAKLLRYHRYQCNDCGKWFRSSKSVTPKGEERFIGVD